MRLGSKVIVITGGSYGLGKALTKACCKEGARVAIIGRNSSKLELPQYSRVVVLAEADSVS